MYVNFSADVPLMNTKTNVQTQDFFKSDNGESLAPNLPALGIYAKASHHTTSTAHYLLLLNSQVG